MNNTPISVTFTKTGTADASGNPILTKTITNAITISIPLISLQGEVNQLQTQIANLQNQLAIKQAELDAANAAQSSPTPTAMAVAMPASPAQPATVSTSTPAV